MNLSIKGKVVAILPKTSGTSAAGKAWEKQDFVIEEIEGQYPAQVAFTVFNKLEIIAEMRTDDEVDVSFNIKATEYNDRWFNNITAWKVAITKTSGAKPNTPAEDMPPAFDPQKSLEEQTGNDENQDLPF